MLMEKPELPVSVVLVTTAHFPPLPLGEDPFEQTRLGAGRGGDIPKSHTLLDWYCRIFQNQITWTICLVVPM